MIPHSVCASLSTIVYITDLQARLNSYTALGFSHVATFGASDDHVDVVCDKHKEHWAVVNRGTESGGYQGLTDWGANLRFMRWYDWRTGWCHKGHLRGAQKLWKASDIVRLTVETLKSVVNLASVEAKSITFTGHSRGGGLANLEAALFISELMDEGLVARSPANLYVVTFGAPRISMGKLKKLLHRHTCGVWNYAHTIKNHEGNGDPVPKVMPRIKWLWPYVHPNRVELRAPKDASSSQCHSIMEYFKTIRKVEEDQQNESIRVSRLCGNAARDGLRRAAGKR